MIASWISGEYLDCGVLWEIVEIVEYSCWGEGRNGEVWLSPKYMGKS